LLIVNVDHETLTQVRLIQQAAREGRRGLVEHGARERLTGHTAAAAAAAWWGHGVARTLQGQDLLHLLERVHGWGPSNGTGGWARVYYGRGQLHLVGLPTCKAVASLT
jgi:hypothetical protein